MAAYAMNLLSYVTMTPLSMSTTQSLYVSNSFGFTYGGTDYPVSPVSMSMAAINPGTTFERAVADYQLASISQSNVTMLSSGTTRTFERAPGSFTLSLLQPGISGSIADFTIASTQQMANTASLSTLVAVNPGGPMARFAFDPIPYPQPPAQGTTDVGRFRKSYPHTRVRPKFRKYIT